MIRWALSMVLALGLLAAGSAAEAGRYNWSVGYSDYGRHGGYSIELGRFGGQRYSAVSFGAPAWYGPSWGSYSYDYGYREPWYLSSYRRPVSYGYRDCYYGCGYGYSAPRYYRSSYRYIAPRYYGYTPRYYGGRYTSVNYGYRHDRHDRYDRYDRYDRHDRGYDRHDDRYRQSARGRDYGGGRSESAYERAREHSYNGR